MAIFLLIIRPISINTNGVVLCRANTPSTNHQIEKFPSTNPSVAIIPTTITNKTAPILSASKLPKSLPTKAAAAKPKNIGMDTFGFWKLSHKLDRTKTANTSAKSKPTSNLLSNFTDVLAIKKLLVLGRKTKFNTKTASNKIINTGRIGRSTNAKLMPSPSPNTPGAVNIPGPYDLFGVSLMALAPAPTWKNPEPTPINITPVRGCTIAINAPINIAPKPPITDHFAPIYLSVRIPATGWNPKARMPKINAAVILPNRLNPGIVKSTKPVVASARPCARPSDIRRLSNKT